MTYGELLYEIKEILEEYDLDVRTFEEAGLLSANLGLVIQGQQFEWLNSWGNDLDDEISRN